MVLIDGNSLINRAYFALPPLNSNDGTPSNAVYGFATMLIKLIADYRPKYIAVAFDMRAPTFRHKMYDGYKATRKGMPDDLAVQMPKLKTMLRAMNIRMIEKEGIEADDIIGTMSKKFDIDTMIVTGDRDCLQLVGDTTSVLLTKRGISETVLMTPDTIVEATGLTAAQVIEYKALAGDSSDNIPGVMGVGDKTATDLLQKYGTLEGVYEHLGEIKGKLNEKLAASRDIAELSRVLATIKTDCELDVELAECTYDYPFSGAVMDVFSKHGFRSLMKRTEIFTAESEDFSEHGEVTVTALDTPEEFAAKLNGIRKFAVAVVGDIISIAVSGEEQYDISTELTLLAARPDMKSVMLALKGALEDDKTEKLVYDAKRLMHLLQKYGITLKNYTDIALMQYLSDMSIRYSNAASYAEECGYNKKEGAACLFARAAELTKDLSEQDMTKLYNELELPLIGVLFDMENAGFTLDLERLGELGTKYEKEEGASAAKIIALAGHDFNVNSPKQLGHVLFDELKIPYPGKKTGAYSTAADVLSLIPGSEIVDEILRYRFLSKIRSTYIDGLKKVTPASGVVHTEFNQMLTTTGRLSSSEPNLQNIPVREDEGRMLRALFVAGEGNVLVAADYSQIELRVMAHFSGDENLISAFENGIDVHTAVACELFDVSKENVTGQMRRVAKTVNFGIIYGMSAFGLASRLGISNKRAKEYIDKYFAKYPKIKTYLDGVVAEAKQLGYTTSILGRRRVIPELKSSDYKRRSFGERAAMNMPLQASAADIIKLAMLRVSRRLDGLKSKLILQVHDELIIEATADETEQVKKLLKEEMENAMKLRVPLLAEVKTGKNWLECK